MEYTRIELEDDNAELIDNNRLGNPNPNLRSLKRDTRDLLRLLESTAPPSTLGLVDVSNSGWVYRKKLNGEWKKYFCNLDGNLLYFFDHPGVSILTEL